MYIKLENDTLKTINRASDITCTDYELLGNFIPVESMMCIVEDLLLEIVHLKECIEDMEQDIENNYDRKEFDPYDEYGVSRNDF